MKNKHKLKTKQWKPVDLEGAVLSNIDGLIGIEELTDYSLIDDDDEKKSCSINQPPAKKRKTSKQLNKKSYNGPTSDDTSEETKLDDDSDFNSEVWKQMGVPDVILKGLKDLNFNEPTTIQSLTLASAIYGRRDILGAAETGSGKTLAFGIPILAGILELKEKETPTSTENESKLEGVATSGSTTGGWFVSSAIKTTGNKSKIGIQKPKSGLGCVRVIDNIELTPSNHKLDALKPLYALILTPTRELAIQIKDHITKVGKYTGIKIAVVVGGMAAVKQERMLNHGPEIVIATPGRLWELINEGNPHLSQLNTLKYLAIDETDRMLEKGHFAELHDILEKINFDEKAVQKRQTFVFSATLTLTHELPDYLMRIKMRNNRSKIFKLTPGQKLQKIIHLLQMKNPKTVDITQEKGTASKLTECRITCTIDHKDYYLYYFLKRHEGRTLIFCNSIGCVKRLATLFGILQCNPLPLHANMIQKQRLKNLERFQANPQGILVATDVAARGLDIPNVQHVIHYQVPRTSESYIHRSGRTARAQKEGITILIMEPSELQYYTKLCKNLGRTEDIPTFPVVDRLLIAVKECVNLAREVDKLELISKRDSVKKSWMKKAAEDMDIELDDDQVDTQLESDESASIRRQLNVKKKQLTSLLEKPLFPKGFSGKYFATNISLPTLKDNESAVDVMKSVISESVKKKK